MRGKTLAVWLVLAFSCVPGFLAADTVDDLVAAALSGDEKRLESASTAAMNDKDFPFPKACAKVADLGSQMGPAEKDKKKSDSLMQAIRVLLVIIVDKTGDKEIPDVVSKLIEAVNKGVAQSNVLVEAAISSLCIHGFTDADYKADATDVANWDDHKKMWTKWWAANGTKPQKARIMGGMARAGVKLDFGNGDDTALDSMMQTLINALTHEQIYIRANAYRLIRSGCFQGLKIQWNFDPEAPQASRQKSIEECRKAYLENKAGVFGNLRGK